MSPSGPVIADNIAGALDVLSSWGLEVELDDDVYTRADPGYFAGDDATRAAAINRGLGADCDAVLFSRGGYGLTRILDELDFSRLDAAPKWVIGFSDVTAFHLAARAAGCGVATVHGHVAKSFASQSQDLDALHALLFDHALADAMELVTCANPAPEDVVTGRLIGGNASLVAAMLDSSHCPDFAGDVLFLEDVGEADYRLDRLLTAIGTSRRADGVAAVVLGDFTDCAGVYVDEADFEAFLHRLGVELSQRLGAPVYRGLASGHGARNVPLVVGQTCRLEGNSISMDPIR